jgi:hypothetical protein
MDSRVGSNNSSQIRHEAERHHYRGSHLKHVRRGRRRVGQLIAARCGCLIVRVIVMAMARRNGLGFAQIRAAPVASARRDTLKLSKHRRQGDEDDQLRANHCDPCSKHSTISVFGRNLVSMPAPKKTGESQGESEAEMKSRPSVQERCYYIA